MERKSRDQYQGGGKSPTWRKRTPRKSVVTSARESLSGDARFEFQKRFARIDWRALHSVDVDRVIREVDIDTLESVLDTVAFGDVQGEDTRKFTEANFVKIFRLAQLMVEYLLHVQDLLSDHKSGLLQSTANMERKNDRIRSRFLCQKDALLQTRHELKQAKKTLKTYEVMLKVQEKNNQTSQSTQAAQAWHCPSCEKAFESSYYLDMHVARKHKNKQEMTDEKILAVVATAEEASAARVKAEMNSTVQAEIQQLRERYQADLQRAETNSNTQVQTLQEDLRLSNNQLHEVQTRLEVLQAQSLSTSPHNFRLGSLLVMEKSKVKCHGPNQERLYELESKFSGLERQVKTLGQENSRLLKDLSVAYTEASDLQFAKRQSAFALETQIDDLRKENQHLRGTVSKVQHTAVQAGFMGERHDKLKAHYQVPEKSSMEAFLVRSSRLHSPPKSPQSESEEFPSKLQEDEANSKHTVHPYHEIPEPILAIIEAKEPSTQTCDFSDSQNLDLDLIQPSNALNICVGLTPVLRQPPFSGRPKVSMPLKKLNFSGGVMLTNMIEEPAPLSMHEERRGSSQKERWIDKDEALRALARPTSWKRRTETKSEEPSDEGESSPEPERCTQSTSPVKRALRFITPSPERMRMSYKERLKKPAAAKKSKLRGGGDIPITAEEMRAKLELEMAASNEEQKKRQKAVEQLLAKELVQKKRKMENRTRTEDTGSSKAASPFSFTSKSETPSESIVPLLLALPKKLETFSPSSTIHAVREIVHNRLEIERIQPNLCPPPGTRIQPFHLPAPYKPGPCCKKPLHPYLRRGIGNHQTEPQPRTSLHMAVLSSNPDLNKVPRNRIPNQKTPPSKEHIMERLSAVTRELGKYFPTEKPQIQLGTLSGSAHPTVSDIETTETETNEIEVSGLPPAPLTIVFDARVKYSKDLMEDEFEKRSAPDEDEKIPRPQGISNVGAMDVGEVAHHMSMSETETETESQSEKASNLSGQLFKELKRFGIGSTTNGISDTTYKSISSALKMQRSVRLSQIHGAERQIVEYERDAVVWHTRMAVRDRDLVEDKPPFNVVTDSRSDHFNTSQDGVEESGRSNKSNESGCESREDSRERNVRKGGASDMKHSDQSSPQSSESTDDIQEYNSNNANWAKHTKAGGSVHLGPRSPPPEGRVQYVSRTHSWEPTLKQANSSRNVRAPPSRREVVRSIADVIDHNRQSEEVEVNEDAFGLGDWDSDEDKEK